MSIRFNHANNTMTSTDTATILIEGGSPSQPRSLILNASSIIFPNKQLPLGEAGAVVFDINSKTLKYHDGFKWVELLSQDEILAPIQVSLTDIYNQLANRVRTVTYSSSSVPSASVSGTNLNIIFPSSTTGGSTDVPGLFTSSPPGSIMQYALSSGQSVASIREQMSGVTNGQNGRNGTAGAPYVTKTGWCFADGAYWTWNGEGGAVTKIVPNLNQDAYLKSITTNGVTKTDSVIAGSGSISSTSIQFPQHYHGVGSMQGLSGSSGDDAAFIIGKTFNDGKSYNGAIITGDKQQYWTTRVNGSDTRKAISTTDAIYYSGDTTSHSHNLTNVDVSHFNVAILYNIAEPSSALNQKNGDARYVLKAGDVMTGSLTIANSATIQANDTNVVLWFRNANGGERSVIYHSNTTNTLRFRVGGGNEMALYADGGLSVSSLVSGGSITSSSLTVNGAASVGTLNSNGITSSSLTVTGVANTGSLNSNTITGTNLTVNGSAGINALTSNSIVSNGSITGSTLTIGGAATTGVLNVNGQITATGDIWAFSDIKLKENLKPITNAVETVQKINGVIGNMIGEDQERSMVIAQEVLAAYPVVVEEDDSGYLKVNYIGLIPLLLNSISELKSEIEELKRK